jgi:phospholipase/carboxylesterase
MGQGWMAALHTGARGRVCQSHATMRVGHFSEMRMSVELLPSIELETAPKPTASVIWLHGLGADGNDFVPVVRELALPASLPIRFVFPHAPVRPVTINNGFKMRAWYDIAAADLNNRADLAGVKQSQVQVEALIAREVGRGIPASRIVVAGFSQGGAIALYTGLRHAERLAGIIALSTYLIGAEALAIEAASINRDVPIFMAHGTADPVVRFEWGNASRQALVDSGYKVEWHTYGMEHSVCMEEIGAVSAWLQRVLRS